MEKYRSLAHIGFIDGILKLDLNPNLSKYKHYELGHEYGRSYSQDRDMLTTVMERDHSLKINSFVKVKNGALLTHFATGTTVEAITDDMKVQVFNVNKAEEAYIDITGIFVLPKPTTVVFADDDGDLWSVKLADTSAEKTD